MNRTEEIIKKVGGTMEFIGFLTGFSAVGQLEHDAPLIPWLVVLGLGMLVMLIGEIIRSKFDD